MTWLIFALCTPILYSITNYIEKFLVEKRIKNPLLLTISYSGFSIFIFIIFLVFRGLPPISIIQLLVLLTSGALLIFYLIPYFIALSIDDATRIVPLFQFTPLYILVVSYIFLHESLSTVQLAGFFVVLVGGFILGLEKFERKMFKLRKSFILMLLSSFLFAMVSFLFKICAVSLDFWTVIAYQCLGAGIASTALLLFSPKKSSIVAELKELKYSSWLLIAINNSFAILANLSVSYAMILGSTAVVSVIANGTQPFFLLIEGIILTKIFPSIIKENIEKNALFVKVFSILIIFFGIYLVNK